MLRRGEEARHVLGAHLHLGQQHLEDLGIHRVGDLQPDAVREHPEFASAETDADGAFQLAVNGGGATETRLQLASRLRAALRPGAAEIARHHGVGAGGERAEHGMYVHDDLASDRRDLD